MTVDNLEARLAAMQRAFNEAPVNTGGSIYDLPPDGKYQALVHAFEFKEPWGVAMLETVFEIQNSDKYDGRRPSILHDLEDPERIGWLKGHLEKLGVNTDDLDLRELRPGSPTLQEVLDTPVEIAVVTSKKINQKTGEPYRNVYLNERLGGPITSDVPAPPVPKPASAGRFVDAEIPFAFEEIPSIVGLKGTWRA